MSSTAPGTGSPSTRPPVNVSQSVGDEADWIPVNAAAWLVGLSFTLLPSPFVDETTPPTVLAVAFGLGGVAMATTVAVGTGVGMRRMLANQSRGAGREGGN